MPDAATKNCTHGWVDSGPGFYCSCGQRMNLGECPCGCRQKSAGELRREQRLSERRMGFWKVVLVDGTSWSGHVKETRYVQARSRLEAIRKAGWKTKMGWDGADAHRIKITGGTDA